MTQGSSASLEAVDARAEYITDSQVHEEPSGFAGIVHPFRFHGDATEFFRIWIVNVALTVLTLGIYSAWAKVRTRRYFYASTEVAGSRMEYLARPIPILIGRGIAVALLIAYLATAQFAPIAHLFLILALVLAAPWIIVKALAFRARYSAWRGLNFRFIGGYGEAIVNFLLLPVLGLISLGLAWPWVKAQQQAYIAEGHRFGGHQAVFRSTTAEYYQVYVVVVAVGVALVMGITLLNLMAMEGGSVYLGLALIIGYFAYLAIFVFLRVKLTNLFWNGMDLDGHRFQCNLRTGPMFAIYSTNLVAIVLSLGLMIPWAMVRTARYRAQCLTLLATDDLESFVAEARHARSAAGAEIGEVFDIDVGF